MTLFNKLKSNSLSKKLDSITAFANKAIAQLNYLIREPHYPLTGVQVNEEAITVIKLRKNKNKWEIITFDKEPLEENIIKLSPLQPNVIDLPLSIQHMRNLWSRNELTDKNLCLLIPDKAVIIFITKLNLNTPKKEEERLLKWKLRKSVPFPIDEAKMSWMPLYVDNIEKKINILVVLVKNEILLQYERIARSVDANVAVVDISFFNLFNYLSVYSNGKDLMNKDFILINPEGSYVSLGLFTSGKLKLFKCRSLLHKSSEKLEEYRKELIRELHPVIMYYFDQLRGKNLEKIYLKAGNSVIGQLMKEKYGFEIQEADLAEDFVISNSLNIQKEALNPHVSLIGLLLGRKPIW